MTEMIRSGFAGAGFMARVHSRAALVAGATLSGIAGTKRTTELEQTARSLAVHRVFEDVDDMLADPDIDVVHVCTPNSSHYTIAAAALRAGKHVICEKPLALDPSQARRLADQANDLGLIASVPFVYRYHPMVEHARSRIVAGTTGRISSVTGTYLQDWLSLPTDDDWRVDPVLGGKSRAFADIGSHLCDSIEFVTGDRIARLTAVMRTVHENRAKNTSITTEDIAGVMFETDLGAVGTIRVSQVAPGRKNALTWEISGTAETLRFVQEDPETLFVGGRESSMLVRRDPSASHQHPHDSVPIAPWRTPELPAGHPVGYQDIFTTYVGDVYAAIRGDASADFPSFVDGARAAVITDAVLTSAHNNNIWIEVS